MLVLERKDREVVNFPDLGISITVVQSKRGRCRLGITAPSDVLVLRGELPRLTKPEPAITEDASDAA